jgi:hypothetical protein
MVVPLGRREVARIIQQDGTPNSKYLGWRGSDMKAVMGDGTGPLMSMTTMDLLGEAQAAWTWLTLAHRWAGWLQKLEDGDAKTQAITDGEPPFARAVVWSPADPKHKVDR